MEGWPALISVWQLQDCCCSLIDLGVVFLSCSLELPKQLKRSWVHDISVRHIKGFGKKKKSGGCMEQLEVWGEPKMALVPNTQKPEEAAFQRILCLSFYIFQKPKISTVVFLGLAVTFENRSKNLFYFWTITPSHPTLTHTHTHTPIKQMLVLEVWSSQYSVCVSLNMEEIVWCMAPDARCQMLYRLTCRSGIRLVFRAGPELINLLPPWFHRRSHRNMRVCESVYWIHTVWNEYLIQKFSCLRMCTMSDMSHY